MIDLDSTTNAPSRRQILKAVHCLSSKPARLVCCLLPTSTQYNVLCARLISYPGGFSMSRDSLNEGTANLWTLHKRNRCRRQNCTVLLLSSTPPTATHAVSPPLAETGMTAWLFASFVGPDQGGASVAGRRFDLSATSGGLVTMGRPSNDLQGLERCIAHGVSVD